MTKLYHQLGFRYQWNLESLQFDGVGDGVIVGPRYMEKSRVEALPEEVRKSSLFDPQFFLPATPRGSLATYTFFPNVVSGGFESSEYAEGASQRSAELCLRFQADLGFESFVIPTRYREGAPADFVESQSRLFVEPFLEAARGISSRRGLLQLILTEQMLKDTSFRNSLLNWVTGIEDLSGVYLIADVRRPHKQIDDIELLDGLLRFVFALRRNDMEVVLGYLNTEILLLLAADPTAVATGSYENLRMFSTTAFVDEEPTPRRGPNARLYISQLCQWVDTRYLGAIRRALRDADSFFDQTRYHAEMFQASYNWHFARPEPYKHYFQVIADQVRCLSQLSGLERVSAIRATLTSTLDRFRQLEAAGVILDSDSAGSHISAWLTELNLFEQEVLSR